MPPSAREALRDASSSMSGSMGVHFNIRLEDDRLCTLVMIGARSNGEKELLAVEDGYRESAESWKALLRDLPS